MEQPEHQLVPIWDLSTWKIRIQPFSHCTGPHPIVLSEDTQDQQRLYQAPASSIYLFNRQTNHPSHAYPPKCREIHVVRLYSFQPGLSKKKSVQLWAKGLPTHRRNLMNINNNSSYFYYEALQALQQSCKANYYSPNS